MLPIRNTLHRYGLVSLFFHWAVVVLLIVQYTWAFRIDRAEGLRVRFELVTQHKTLGMVILALVILRLLWRVFNRPPPLPVTMPRWERYIAGITHWLLYGLVLAMPVTGWLYSSAAGFGEQWWGPVNFPALIESSEFWQDWFGLIHRALAIALATLVGLHVLAALRHQFVVRDDILRRMLPFWRSGS